MRSAVTTKTNLSGGGRPAAVQERRRVDSRRVSPDCAAHQRTTKQNPTKRGNDHEDDNERSGWRLSPQVNRRRRILTATGKAVRAERFAAIAADVVRFL